MNLTRAAIGAGDIAERIFQDGLQIETKQDGTPVTNADLAVRNLFMEFCERLCPSVAYLGEEGQAGPKDAEEFLVADEIDGTNGFKDGKSDCAIILARAKRDGDNVVFTEAVINNFREGRCFTAHEGGLWITGVGGSPRKIKMISRPENRHFCPRVSICTWPTARHRLREAAQALEKAGFSVNFPMGVAAMAGRIVLGKTDCVVFPGENTNPDGSYAKCSWHEGGPMELLIQTAGGIFSDLTGHPQRFIEVERENGYPDFKLPMGFVGSCNAQLHERVLEIIAPHLEF